MTPYREVTPVPGPEAFAESSPDARMSQAAIVLSAGAAVAGEMHRVAEPAALDLPAELAGIATPEKVPVARAIAPLGLDLDAHLGQRGLRLPADMSVALTRQLIDQPQAETAAALVEANLHSESPLVRTSAAVAALDTTGAREDVRDQLVEGARSRDRLTRELGRTGLARIDPQHPLLRHLRGRPSPLTGTDRKSHTAVLTHGTFAARTHWWQPGGDFYTYLDALAPPLNLHDPLRWSGLYSDGARQLAANHLVAWLADQGLPQPDFLAHSHGGTVANLATQRGQRFDRLVLLSWPVHPQWAPTYPNTRRILDVRVHVDLVIIADRGGQRLTLLPAYRSTVTSLVNGWFDHGATREPAYWERYDLPDRI